MSDTVWSAEQIPDQLGQVVIVTGANSGIGKETARELARKGANVTLAVRNVAKGQAAASEILAETPDAHVQVSELDLSDFSSIRKFADDFIGEHGKLDLLINNAGIMMCPFSKTKDGLEIQMGTNHFGHFALTGQLLPLLRDTEGARVVNVASMAHKGGKIDFEDINWADRKYKKIQAYCDSKIANLYFTYELKRRLAEGNEDLIVTAAHPGWTRTNLQKHNSIFRFLNPFMGQPPDMGALPTLRAAVDPAAKSGDYFGPDGRNQMRGWPVKVDSNDRSKDMTAAGRLWDMSEDLTGVSFPI